MEQTPRSNTTPQQVTKDLAEIFKLRATSLFMNTLVLYWPILALVLIYSSSSIAKVVPLYGIIEPYVSLLLVTVFLFYSVPKIGLDRVEKRFWIKRYLTTGQVVSPEESKDFMHTNKNRIAAYKRLTFTKFYLIPLVLTFGPILAVIVYIAIHVITNSGSQLFASVVLGSFVGVPLLIAIFLFYWLHTRTVLLYAWERFIDAVDSKEDVSNKQILKDSRRLVKLLGLKGRAKFMSYDFTASTVVSLPAAAVVGAAQLAPKPVRQTIATFAQLYALNAYLLENLAITYLFYMESKAKDAQKAQVTN